ncbi:MAG: glycine betaine ABC transporter substrate-binding protein [Hyphomicrobiaceae bacterium]
MKQIFLSIIGAAAATSMMSSVAVAKCGEVSITEMNWASSQVVTAVAKFIMEQGYGCKVTKVPSATVTAVASMAETNKPDIATEIWLNSAALYPKLVKEGKVKTLTNVLSDGGEENWWIPKYLAEKHPELKTIDGVLKNPKLVGEMFHNCPTGWGCRIANDNLKVAYKLEESGIKVFDHGSGETLASSLAAAYADKKPWFGYYWAPTAVLGKYPMVKVDMGPHNAEYHTCNQKKDCATPRKSSYPAAPVLTAVTTTFAKREPAISELMSKVAFTNAQMGEILAWKKDGQKTADEAAAYFLTKYKDVWGGWLNADAQKKLAAVLK